MILKAFKEKSNKKYLNKLISNRYTNVNDQKINSLGVILNIDEIDDLELFRSLSDDLNVHPNKLKVIAFSADKKEQQHSWDLCFNPDDFGWKGHIKHVELQTFLKMKFDALISYYTSEQLELKLLTAMSEAQFKVGILQADMRLNDLIIKTPLKDFNVFKKELFKYLNILKKIKNEK